MAKHTVKEHCQIVEKSLVQKLENLLSTYNESQLSCDQEESLKNQMSFVLRLMDVWVSWKSGSLITDPAKIFNVSTCANCTFSLLCEFENGEH